MTRSRTLLATLLVALASIVAAVLAAGAGGSDGRDTARIAASSGDLAAAGVVAPAHGTAGYCGISWGSLTRSGGDPTLYTGNLTGIRAGRHDCYDRLVLDLGTHATADLAWRVRYAPVHAEGSGERIPLRGAADLEIGLAARADDGHVVTFDPRDPTEVVDVRGFTAFRQVAYGGSFEARTTVGLGVRARLPFRAFTVDGPGEGARLVVDVAHRW